MTLMYLRIDSTFCYFQIHLVPVDGIYNTLSDQIRNLTDTVCLPS